MSNDVVISKELRDRWLDDLVEADTDAHKYSQEHGAGGYIENCQLCEDIEALRAAPETVSLEGVDVAIVEWLRSVDWAPSKIEAEEFARRLVAPVQPSAVVNREAIANEVYLEKWKTLFGTAIVYLRTKEGCEIAAERFTEEYEKLERESPQPVAPVQSGGVVKGSDLYWKLYRALDVLKEDGTEGFSYDNGYTTVEDLMNELSHLTTAQSAPSVGSVPQPNQETGEQS